MTARLRRLAVLVGFELRGLLRDRKTVVLTVLLPLLVMPLLVFGTRKLEAQRDEEDRARVFGYAIDERDAAWIAQALAEGLRALPELERPQLREVSRDDPTMDVSVAVGRDSEVATIELAYHGNVHQSRLAMEGMSRALAAARKGRVVAALHDAGFPGDPATFVVVTERDVASAIHRAGARLGTWLTPVLVMMLMFGGQLAALDTLAGERERGTLETLLTTAVDRGDVVLGKWLTVFVVALINASMSFLSLWAYARWGAVESLPDASIALTPSMWVWLALLCGALAWLVSAVLLAVSGTARTYKEAQLYVGVATLALAMLGAASLLGSLRWQLAFAFLPVANVSLAVREVLAGRPDALLLVVTIAVDLAVGGALARWVVRALHEERLIVGTVDVGTLRGEAALRRATPAWVAGTWAIFMLGALLWPGLDLRLQLLFNLVGLMLAGSLILALRQRVALRELWGLRWPNPWAFLGVVLGVPSGLVLVGGLARLLEPYVGMPTRMQTELEALFLGADLPLWQQLLWMAVLPGVCEELYFRGFLMFGLRDRLRPVARCLVVAAIFGAFHLMLSRLLPTATLGVFLGATRLLAGSTIPAIAWHALHNGAALGLSSVGDESVTFPAWAYAIAVVGLVTAFAVLWRFRQSVDPKES